MSMCCNDCKNIDASVIDVPCATCQIVGGPTLNFEFVPGRRNAPDPDKEGARGRDLAIWWEARKAFMTGHFALARWAEVSDGELDNWADYALERYKAKAAELSKTCK